MANKLTDAVRLSISAIHGDITFSKRDVYVWVRLGGKHYEFQNDFDRETMVEDFNVTLANILTSEEKELECQLIVTSDVFDVDNWQDTQLTLPSNADSSYYFSDFAQRMANHMTNMQFRTKSVYMGVNLGLRQDFNPKKTTFGIPGIDRLTMLFTGEIDEYLTAEELVFWEDKARLVRQSLAESRMQGEEVSGAELAYIIRKNMFPAMPSPTVKELSISDPEEWGAGELQTLVDGEVNNKPLWLEISQDIDGVTHTGYRATLSFSKFPSTMRYPQSEPWMHFVSLLPFPVDLYTRFTIEPSRKVRKQVRNKIKSIEDQAVNMTSAGGGLNIEIQEQHQLGQYLEYALGQDDTPWLYGRHRIVVEASNEQELKDRVRAIIDHYKNLGISIVWPRGDQLDLMLEGMPNDRIRLSAYYQRHELSILGAGVPSASGGAGDVVKFEGTTPKNWLGPYIGYTTSRVVEPVFLSMHSAIAKNASPGLVITGSPGSGKSFTAFTLTYNMVLSGTWTIYIDPKGDALPMANLPGVEDAVVVDLHAGLDGLLDPFTMSDNRGERNEMVIETISQFVGQLDDKQVTAVSEVLRLMEHERYPSLRQLTAFLMENKSNSAAVGLGERLNTLSELPFARLCFSPNTGEHTNVLRPDRNLTIITLLGLDLPLSNVSRDEYSGPNRLAVAIMYLLASFTRKLMRNENSIHPKAIVIDEAWAITSTSQGAKLVLEVARMGRSLNTAMILVSQNAGDFLGASVVNSVSTKMAFRANAVGEIRQVLEFFELEDSRANQQVIRNLSNGQCLVSDSEGRVALVQIDGWNNEMRKAFETNPERKRRQAEETAAENQLSVEL